MNGILVVDKPADWTSHDVVAKLRNVLKEKRVGHGGTLDPMATGVLPVFVGRATRAAEFCENAEKEYIAGLRLGLVTDTQDITGNTLQTCDVTVSAEDLSAVIPRFLGAQKQLPPMYSAIKIGGKKLYEMARRGVEIPRPERDVFISDIELMSCGINEFSLRIVCSKGTYIRTLCHDIGAALGCGGTMCALRRTRAGAFTIAMALQLGAVQEAISNGKMDSLTTPVDMVFSEYPAITLNEQETRKCKNGAPCRIGQSISGRYRFYGPDNEFILIGEVKDGSIRVIKSFFEV